MNESEASGQPQQVYVQRNSAGQIVSISRSPASDHEPCPPDQPDVVAFLQTMMPSRAAALVESDLSLIRALEDLIDVLIQKDILVFTDLPEPVQAKLMERRRLRGSVRALNLIGDDHDEMI